MREMAFKVVELVIENETQIREINRLREGAVGIFPYFHEVQEVCSRFRLLH